MNRKALTQILLEIFFTLLLVLAGKLNTYQVPALVFWILFSLAVFRLARTISYNEIAEWLRDPFCRVEKDSCGAGENVHAREDRGPGVQTVGSLLACPICTGTWIALLIFLLWAWVPDVGAAAVIVFGLAGASEMLHYLGEILSWGGRYARVKSGEISPDGGSYDEWEESKARVWLKIKESIERLDEDAVMGPSRKP